MKHTTAILLLSCLVPKIAAFDGQLDTTFGKSGQVLNTFTNFGGGAAQSVAVQPDGKIIAMGYTGNLGSNATFAIARYEINGSLDETFNPNGNTAGLVTTSFGSSLTSANAFSGTLQNDGKMLLVGSAGNNSVSYFGLARYHHNGTLDTSFQSEGTPLGTVITNFGQHGDNAYAVAIQKNEKIIAAGGSDAGGVLGCIALACYNPDGSLDATFNPSGSLPGTVLTILETETLSLSEALGVALQKDGKIVVAGYAGYQKNRQYVIARYLEDGQLDSSFNTEGTNSSTPGVVMGSFGGAFDLANSVVLQDDGKIVIVGQSNALRFPSFAVARYNGDGTPDISFNPEGKTPGAVVTQILNTQSTAQAVLLQKDGRIVVAGSIGGGMSFLQSNFTLARYTANGSLDTLEFNPLGIQPGITITPFRSLDSACQDITFQNDGKIVAAGSAEGSTDSFFALARYLDAE